MLNDCQFNIAWSVVWLTVSVLPFETAVAAPDVTNPAGGAVIPGVLNCGAQTPGAQGTGSVAASTALPLNAAAMVRIAATVVSEDLRSARAQMENDIQFIIVLSKTCSSDQTRCAARSSGSAWSHSGDRRLSACR